jgi:hypothetical protein
MRARISAILLGVLWGGCGGNGSHDINPAPPQNLEWGAEELIEIDGYSGNAMEPKVSADEQFLFFNNKTADDTEMDIHYAVRTGPARYEYKGPLPGVNVSGALDGVPAIDDAGHFYFVSLRSYGSDGVTVYGGTFDGTGSVLAVGERGQNLVSTRSGELIMDVDVTADGKFLVLSRAVFAGGAAPASSDLDLAVDLGSGFVPAPQAAALLGAVNTPDQLEYAGTLSRDGLELYFTRAAPSSADGGARIMVSKRAGPDENFGPPALISGISGTMTEAPSLSSDGKRLYFHKNSAGVFKVFRVSRS